MRTRGWLERSIAMAVVVVLSAGCGDESATGPQNGSTLEALSPTSMTGTVGSAVADAPTVLARDRSGAPMAGVRVSFIQYPYLSFVQSPYLYGTATTGSDGRASLGEWFLGSKPGTYIMRASIPGSLPVDFTAVAKVDVASVITVLDADGGLSGFAGERSGTLSAKVSDRLGNGIADVDVTFAVESGNGALAAVTARTDPRGVAVSGAWTLGAVGANTAIATAADGLTARFSRTALQGGGSPAVYHLVSMNGHDLADFPGLSASFTLTDNGTFLWTQSYPRGDGAEIVYSEAGKFSDTDEGLQLEVQGMSWFGSLAGGTLTLSACDDWECYSHVYRK